MPADGHPDDAIREAGEIWRPSAKLDALRQRAEILQGVRSFFSERSVLEVETPLLASATVTDLHLSSLACEMSVLGDEQSFYLQTSPEFAMKRLVAAGSGPIFQICKAFRDDELGRRHNPEFTMLEWYRPGFDHHLLMDEMDSFLQHVLSAEPADRLSYRDAFQHYVELDPHRAETGELARAAANHGIELGGTGELEHDEWLDLLLSHVIEPLLGAERPLFLFDYPASQAALAKIRPGDPPMAERFEVYVQGVELANGFHELLDVDEQKQRFESDLVERRRRGLAQPPIDHRLLGALAAGMPPCAGVALGIDRLVMLALGSDRIDQVMSFAIDRA